MPEGVHGAPLTQEPGQNFVHRADKSTEFLTEFWKLALVIEVLLGFITLGGFILKVYQRMIKTRLHGTVTLGSLFCCHVLGALTLSRLDTRIRG